MKTILITLCTLLSCLAFGQYDEIIKKNGDTIICEVIEISPDEVRFSLGDGDRKSFFNTDRSKIRRIQIGANTISLNSKNPLKRQYSTLWKMNPIGIFVDNVGITMEKQISQFVSIEMEAMAVLEYNQAVSVAGEGANFRLGAKFYLEESVKRPMHGNYLRTELLVSSLVYRFGNTEVQNFNRPISKSVGLAINYGKQRIFAGSLVFDIYAGLGFGLKFRNSEFERDEEIRRGGWFHGPSQVPIIFNSGIRLGFTAK